MLWLRRLPLRDDAERAMGAAPLWLRGDGVAFARPVNREYELVLLSSVRTPPTCGRQLAKARMARGHLRRKGKSTGTIHSLRADGAARPLKQRLSVAERSYCSSRRAFGF